MATRTSGGNGLQVPPGAHEFLLGRSCIQLWWNWLNAISIPLLADEACDRPNLKVVVSGLASLQKYASEMFYPCNFSCSNSYTFCICWEHRLVMCAIHFNLVFLLMSSSMFPCLIVLTEFRCRLLRTLCWASNMIKIAQTKSCYLLSVKLLPESRDIEGWWL